MIQHNFFIIINNIIMIFHLNSNAFCREILDIHLIVGFAIRKDDVYILTSLTSVDQPVRGSKYYYSVNVNSFIEMLFNFGLFSDQYTTPTMIVVS